MKNIGKLMLAVSVMMIFAIQSNAQIAKPAKPAAQKQNAVNSASGNFVDKNNNGICDNYEARPANTRGRNYVDKDGNGICDNRAQLGKKQGKYCRNGQGNQHRHGQGRGYGNPGRR